METEMTADQVTYLKAIEKAEKYWTASDAERAVFEAAGGPAIVEAANKQEFPAHIDGNGTRAYLAMTGPSVKDPALRELVVVLHESMKAHAIAHLLGVPPKTVGPMRAAGLKARTEQAAKPVAA